MTKQAYLQAVGFFMDAVARIGPNQWNEPALGVWSVRDLVGHTGRSIFIVEEFGSQRSDTIDVESAAHHYHLSLTVEGVDDMIADRGREAGEALGEDPLSRLAADRERVERLVGETDEGAIIAYTNGGIRLGDYLETRVLELVVHTLDLSNALGIEAEPPREALGVALHLLAELALDSGHGGSLALVATGRGVLPDRFSVLG